MLNPIVNAELQSEVTGINESTAQGMGQRSFTDEERAVQWPLCSVRLEHEVVLSQAFLDAQKAANPEFHASCLATLKADTLYFLVLTQTGDRMGNYRLFDPASGALDFTETPHETTVNGKAVTTTRRAVKVVNPKTERSGYVRQQDLKGSFKMGLTNAVSVTPEQIQAAFGGRDAIAADVYMPPLAHGGLGLEPDWSDRKLHAQILADLPQAPVVASTPPAEGADSGNDEEVPV